MNRFYKKIFGLDIFRTVGILQAKQSSGRNQPDKNIILTEHIVKVVKGSSDLGIGEGILRSFPCGNGLGGGN